MPIQESLSFPELRGPGAAASDIHAIVSGGGGNNKRRLDIGRMGQTVEEAIRAITGTSRSRGSGLGHPAHRPDLKIVAHGATLISAQNIVTAGIFRQERLHVHFPEWGSQGSVRYRNCHFKSPRGRL